MRKTLVEEYVEDPIHMRLFQQERAIYEITELLEEVMRELGISRSDLAKKLGKSKGWVTQLLDGEANKTIRTVADAFAVLGREYRSFQCPIRIGGKAVHEKTAIKSKDEGDTAVEAKSVIKLHEVDGFRVETKSAAERPPEVNISSMA